MMSTYYVIQVWAYHGVGTQGWRMVNQRAGQPFRFRTREEAETAMREHFGNLREGVSVRVHKVVAAPCPPGQSVPLIVPTSGYSRVNGGEAQSELAANIRADIGLARNLSSSFYTVMPSGQKYAKHLFELKICVVINAESVGVRPSSAMAPARHIQFSTSCWPLSSIAESGACRQVS